ncbi:MAG: Xaa-Pro peptidase family protein [Alphaproteobacteria bacterium]
MTAPLPAAPERGFAEAELVQRTQRAQALMREAGFDLLLLTTEPEVRYFSGFLTPFWQSPTRPWFLLVPRAGKPVAVIPEIGGACMARTWLDDIRTWPAPRPDDDGVSLLTEAIRELAGDAATVGLPMGHESHLRMPLADFQRLRERLPGLDVADATPLVRRLRMVKSDAEVAKIAHVATLVSDAFDQAPRLFRVGMPLVEAFRAFKTACLGLGVDDVPYLVGGAGPGGYDDIISPPGERPLADGDVLMLDTGCTFDGYFCDFDRNFAIGDTSDAARRAYDTLYRATEAGLAAVRPGAACREVHRAMRAVLEADGGATGNVGRFGHGLGMQLTEWPSHAAFDTTVIEPGMVLTLEPAMAYGDGRMMVHEENLVVRDDGPELLTRRAPRALPRIG